MPVHAEPTRAPPGKGQTTLRQPPARKPRSAERDRSAVEGPFVADLSQVPVRGSPAEETVARGGGLPIGRADDPAEAQADRMAEAALAGGTVPAASPKPTTAAFKTSADLAPASVLQTMAQPGRALDRESRTRFEATFRRDLSAVRIHDGPLAGRSAAEVDAHAWSADRHIAFAHGTYRPGTPSGDRLLAHEIAHVVQGTGGGAPVLRRKGVGVDMGELTTKPWQPPAGETYARMQVFATSMDDAAQVLARTFPAGKAHNLVLIGLDPKFVKVYDARGKSLGNRIGLKEVKGLSFIPGVYQINDKGEMVALTISSERKKIVPESGGSYAVQQSPTAIEKKVATESAKAEGKVAQPAIKTTTDIGKLVSEPDRFLTMARQVSNPLFICFVPSYQRGSGKGGHEGGAKQIYASPIERRGDGKAANAPPWPVSVDGPQLVPTDSTPTFSAKVDWTANGNSSLPSQVISQVGETIHYRWERYDITQYARKEFAKRDTERKADAGAEPEKTLEQRIEELKTSQKGSGENVTGTGGARREFRREFENWSKDNDRAAKRLANPRGDTEGERLSNAAANRLSLELAPVSLLTTAVGATFRLIADFFAGPRKQQEVSFDKDGVYLVRVITTPSVHEDRQGNEIIRPPSVAAKVTEVAPMERAADKALDEPVDQLKNLEAEIKLATVMNDTKRLAQLEEAKLQIAGSPRALLEKMRDRKQAELDEFRKNYRSLSDYSRQLEVDTLNEQIERYDFHAQQRTERASTDLGEFKRVNAVLISEITGENYPLLLSAGPMAMQGSKHRWMISDVTNKGGEAYIGLGDTPSAAFRAALERFGDKAAYGRGLIGVTTTGLGLEGTAPAKMTAESAPADWALAEKRIDDLVATLALLGLVVASAGTAGAIIGATVAAARLIHRAQTGGLKFDAQTMGDVLSLLGGVGAVGQLASGLRVAKLGGVFTVLQEGRVAEAQLARAAEALQSAKSLERGVELANEALNYGGLVWGNVSFIDRMIEINGQVQSGAMTHAAARRERADAFSSAVQNNGLFLAGNVMKARQANKGRADPHAAAVKEGVAPKAEPMIDGQSARETVPREAEKSKLEPGEQRKSSDPGTRVEPVPLSERRATKAEMQSALPPDLRDMVTIDDTLKGDTVRVRYALDKATGLITKISVHCGPDARLGTIALHTETVRMMQRYQGFSGRVRIAISRVTEIFGVRDVLGIDPTPGETALFRAKQEVRKLPNLIEAQMQRMQDSEPNAQAMAEAELLNLQAQLYQHMRTIGLGEGGEAGGYVAAEGLSKAKQKKYDELKARLRQLEGGTQEHKDVRWEMYELTGRGMPYAQWEKVYASNQERANKANASVKAEHERLGWGKKEQTIEFANGDVRRIDIADVGKRRGIEVKEYETGIIYASEEILWEVERDAKLVRDRGWDITWVLVDTQPSGPLLQFLLKAGIKVETRKRAGNGASTLDETFTPLVRRR